MRCKLPILFLFIIIQYSIKTGIAQTIVPSTSVDSVSFRGMDVAKDNAVWVSGSRGTIGKSTDNGKTWIWVNPKGYRNFDFRDIEAFSKNIAVAVSAGSPAVIIRTINGGKSWKEVFRNEDPNIFLDGMDFQGKEGFVYGDPIDGFFQLYKSNNKGKNWENVSNSMYLFADDGEAGFAASGTSIQYLNDNLWIGTGGTSSSLLQRNEKKLIMFKHSVPLADGAASKGVFSISFIDDENGIAVGGDYMNDQDSTGTVAITKDGGDSWLIPKNGTFGFRSCVVHITKNIALATGTSGTDVSTDAGANWKNISTDTYNVIATDAEGSNIYIAGSKGNISKIEL